jgi:hypothetical protein
LAFFGCALSAAWVLAWSPALCSGAACTAETEHTPMDASARASTLRLSITVLSPGDFVRFVVASLRDVVQVQDRCLCGVRARRAW